MTTLFAGIDLGSTTTKAILLDEAGATTGRGITNTRANYDVACEVALAEARLDARLRAFERELQGRGPPGGPSGTRAVAEAVSRAIRLARYEANLVELEREAEAAACDPRHAARASELRAVLATIFSEMRRAAPAAGGAGRTA